MKRYALLLIGMMVAIPSLRAEYKWATHFSYTNVQQIAVSSKDVYAVADGALFSVNKLTEEVSTYNPMLGMHDSQIACCQYDEGHDQLLIVYQNGKIDVLKNGYFYYVPDLYTKQLAAHKLCANITIHGDIAYLSMPFGILTFNLVQYTFPDAYYIGDEASEIAVEDVLIQGDSIYAKSGKNVYACALSDNLVDFRFWEKNPRKVSFDTDKGKRVTDSQGERWEAAGKKGVYRKSVTGEENYYLPDGPATNIPYRLTAAQGEVWMVSGGRWASQNNTPGHVMRFCDGKWRNITQETIQKAVGVTPLDMMNVAVDSKNKDHYFVTSYGTGVYEFLKDSVVRYYGHNNSIIKSVVPEYPLRYTRTDGAVYDSDGLLWVQVASDVDTSIVAIFPDGSQRGLNVYASKGTPYRNPTPGEMIVDAKNRQQKWMITCRYATSVQMLNDGGTTFDSSDDVCTIRKEFVDQDGGLVAPDFIYTIAQSPKGDIWLGTPIGPIILSHTVDFASSHACLRLRIQDADKYLLEDERINAFAFDSENRIWIGTQGAGVYVLSEDATRVMEHFTNTNSVMPSNCVLSLAFDEVHNTMFIGSGSGLVSCDMRKDTTTNLYVDTSDEALTYGTIKQWTTHFSYSGISEAERFGDDIFAVSDGVLFSVNEKDESIVCYNRNNGLNSTSIEHLAYNPTLNKMLITYLDGQLDVMSSKMVYSIPDLKLKTISGSKQVNDICVLGKKAYLGMQFGIVVVDMHRNEIEDTYYIGNNAAEVNVQYLTMVGDTIYASSKDRIYYAHTQDNLIDFSYWHSLNVPAAAQIQGLAVKNDTLCLLQGGVLYTLQSGSWCKRPAQVSLRKLCASHQHLYALSDDEGYWEINDSWNPIRVSTYGQVTDVLSSGANTWMGTTNKGLVRQHGQDYRTFVPDGPFNNISYRVQAIGDKLYMLQGGRWSSQYAREGCVMMYENGKWQNISPTTLSRQTGNSVMDFMNVAQDPKDAQHLFVSSYGCGVFELRDTLMVAQYLPDNSSLKSAAPSVPTWYTRTDGATFDAEGNLWVLNAGVDEAVHVRNSSGQWTSLTLTPGSSVLQLITPGGLYIDRQKPNRKWITLCRYNTGIALLDDGGTPTQPGDDRVYYHNVWTDQNDKQVLPGNIYSFAQDRDNTIWVGTDAGLFTLPTTIDFTKSSACKRIIIPRNDGTGLGDYLLGTECITAIAVDGADRKWIGTQESGVFLMSADGLETIAHFTSANSLMPSNNVSSIAIMEKTGEVFIGTGGGLVSYMGDASQSYESFAQLYAFPNPVRPTYKGYVTIRGLMENSQVRITDAHGNLVKTLDGNGGEVTWDCTNMQGKRVASGIYTAAANTTNGSGHGIIKILIMN